MNQPTASDVDVEWVPPPKSRAKLENNVMDNRYYGSHFPISCGQYHSSISLSVAVNITVPVANLFASFVKTLDSAPERPYTVFSVMCLCVLLLKVLRLVSLNIIPQKSMTMAALAVTESVDTRS